MTKSIKTYAYRDAVAELSNNAAADVAVVADDGSGTHATRYNHVHKLGSATVDGTTIGLTNGVLHIIQYGIDTTQLGDDAVQASNIATLIAPLDCGQQELQNRVIENLDEDPAIPAKGQKWFRTDLGETRICLSAA